MRKILIRIGVILLSIVLICTIAVTVLFRNEFRSLISIKKTDDDGIIQMTYFGDYWFDEFLLIGAENDSEIVEFTLDKLFKGLPVNADIDVTGGGCTVFVTRNAAGEVIYGRNFDFPSDSPPMQLTTCPDNGYASISTANLLFAGFNEDNLPSGLNFNSFPALVAPFIPFDGMNENGVAIALLAVPEAEPPFSEDRVMLNTTTTIRLVLDKAKNVDDAIELLKKYNIYFSGGIYCQFLIADASGRSAIVNYFDGDIKVTETDEDFQIASNFIPYNGLNIGEGFCEFERYDRVRNVIESNDGILSEMQAVDLLAEVGVIDSDGHSRLHWTVIYNLSTLEGVIFANRNTDDLINFRLTPLDNK